jgi:hypothetical protein
MSAFMQMAWREANKKRSNISEAMKNTWKKVKGVVKLYGLRMKNAKTTKKVATTGTDVTTFEQKCAFVDKLNAMMTSPKATGIKQARQDFWNARRDGNEEKAIEALKICVSIKGQSALQMTKWKPDYLNLVAKYL